MMKKKIKPTRGPKVSKRQENPSPEDDSPPFVIINISAENAELDGDIRQNNKVQTNVSPLQPSRDPLPDFLADNPFISGSIGDSGGGGASDPTLSLSPEDVMTILSIMNTGNTASPATTSTTDPVFTTCPAATICVERSR